MNIKLLEKVKIQIISHPEEFVMSRWFCGTAACIGGWACRLSSHTDHTWDIDQRSIALLDISPAQGGRLFYTDMWPRKFREPFMASSCPQGRANIAAARIDHLIDTGF